MFGIVLAMDVMNIVWATVVVGGVGLVLGLLLFACGRSGYFNLFSLVLPLVFVRPVLTVAEFFHKKGA